MSDSKPDGSWLGVGRFPAIAAAVCILAGATGVRAETTQISISSANVAPVTPANAAALDARRLNALGMIETGNDDREVGGAGEISRYQIHPAVWRAYSASRDYCNPRVSLQVARLHWAYLAGYFKEHTGRAPEDFDMYVLWNTRFGYYAHKGFDPARLAPVVRNRAERFVNLVNRRE